MYRFNVEKVTQDCIQWIQDWFEKNGKGCKAVLGMSGGKDSTIAAALCVKALGPERVVGVALPDHGQDINDADKICEYLGIEYRMLFIGNTTGAIADSMKHSNIKATTQAEQNIPPRVRSLMLMAVAQSVNGRMINTCNLSENTIGYMTLFGDDLGAMSPLGQLTATEVVAMGHYLGLPDKWVDKVPDDGLPHSCSDEEKFGFTYKMLDAHIRGYLPQYVQESGETSDCVTQKVMKAVDMSFKSRFKRELVVVPTYKPEPKDLYVSKLPS